MEMNRRLKLLVNSPLWRFLLRRILLPPLFAAIGGRRPDRLLEIGCGRGDTTRLLAGLFPGVALTATDFDAGQVELARRAWPPVAADFRTADATDLPFRDAGFGAVVEFNSFHHIADWRRALRECARVLAPGGWLAVMDETAGFFNPLFRWFDRPESRFTKKEFLDAAAAAGLDPAEDAGSDRIIKLVFVKRPPAAKKAGDPPAGPRALKRVISVLLRRPPGRGRP